MTTATEAVPRPYSFWWHPHKTWLDKIVSALVMWFLPLQRFAQGPAYEDNNVTTAANQKMRDMFAKMAPPALKSGTAQWAKKLGNQEAIVQITLHVPRRRDILQTVYRLPPPPLDVSIPTDDDIVVTLRMPRSVLGAANAALVSKGTNEFGCHTLETGLLDWTTLDPQAPLAIFLHGGGLTIGTSHDPEGLDLVRTVSVQAKKPIIMACLAYSLAPTQVFPTAVTETLTVLSYLMDQMPNRSFHLFGISAGGYLASLTALTIWRRFGVDNTKVSSVLSAVPMVLPAADSMSMYTNRSSSLVPTAWLRWCWRCYLALPPPDDTDVNIFSLPTLQERLVHGSNRTAWTSSPWYQSTAWRRLVDPTVDVPSFNNSTATTTATTNQPRITITTCRGDPLHDDGISLLTALREKGATVKHLDHRGSHWMGTRLDSKSYKELADTWQEMLFG